VLGAGDPGRSSTTLIGGVAEGNPFYPPGSNAFIDVRDVAEPLVDLLDGMEHEGERYVLIGEHRSFQDVMERVAEKIGQRPPRFRAGRFLLETTWRTEHLLRYLSGRKPRISKHTARNGLRNMRYSAKKAQQELGLSPRPIDNAIENAASFYLELQKEKAL
jgi:dihydroflavonol-4-reductase